VTTRLLLLGATGDLAGRFLLPALARSVAAGHLPADLEVVGAAAEAGDDASFRAHVSARWAEHAAGVPAPVRERLLARLRYRRVDLADPATVAEALAASDQPDAPVAVYLALPPAAFPAAVRALAAIGLPSGSRVAVEKPFGHDLDSARALNAALAQATGGDPGAVFRVDHVLGMPRAAELLALRGPGGELEPVWDGAHLEQVDLLWEEDFALRGRAGFYDGTGALKDVLQNHVLQVLVLLAMELPATGDDQALHEAKLALLRAVRVLAPDEVATRTRRARYSAGRLPGEDGAGLVDVPGYAEEAGVDPARTTETYAEVVLDVDAPRWAGTRFVLRVGKGLAATRKGVLLHLRGSGAGANGSATGGAGEQRWIDLDAPTTDEGLAPVQGELAAYEQVLRDVLGGGARLSVSAEEAEQSWRVVEPVLRSWAAGVPPLLEHPAGAPGPGLLPGVLAPAQR